MQSKFNVFYIKKLCVFAFTPHVSGSSRDKIYDSHSVPFSYYVIKMGSKRRGSLEVLACGELNTTELVAGSRTETGNFLVAIAQFVSK